MQGKLHRTLSTLLAAVLFFGISATAYASTGNGNLLQLVKAQSLVAEETEFTLYPNDTAFLEYKLMPENRRALTSQWKTKMSCHRVTAKSQLSERGNQK